MLVSRRGLFGGMAGVLAMPAIVRVESVMRVVRPKLTLPAGHALIVRLAGSHGYTIGQVINDAEVGGRLLRDHPREFIQVGVQLEARPSIATFDFNTLTFSADPAYAHLFEM